MLPGHAASSSQSFGKAAAVQVWIDTQVLQLGDAHITGVHRESSVALIYAQLDLQKRLHCAHIDMVLLANSGWQMTSSLLRGVQQQGL